MRSVVEDLQIEPAQVLGVGDQVDLDDLSVFDLQAEDDTRLSALSPDEPDGSVHERRLGALGTPREGEQRFVLGMVCFRRPCSTLAVSRDGAGAAWCSTSDSSSRATRPGTARFNHIYVNGCNNLENLKAPDGTWKVRLIEENFHRLMFEMEGVRA